jgi:hypothetical protein
MKADMKSLVRVTAIALSGLMGLIVVLLQNPIYARSNVLLLCAMLTGLMFALLKCRKCGVRGIFSGKYLVVPNFGFYFGKTCPHCGIERL